MKKLTTLFVLLAVCLVFVIGCGKTETDATADVVEKVEEATTETVETTETAVEEVVSTFGELKDNYISSAKDVYDNWNSKVDGIVDKKNALPELAQKPLEDPLNALLGKRDDLTESYSGLENSGEDNFDSAKTEFESSVSGVSDAFNKLSSLF